MGTPACTRETEAQQYKRRNRRWDTGGFTANNNHVGGVERLRNHAVVGPKDEKRERPQTANNVVVKYLEPWSESIYRETTIMRWCRRCQTRSPWTRRCEPQSGGETAANETVQQIGLAQANSCSKFSLFTREGQVCLFLCASHGSQKEMGFQGQSARGSVAHHPAGSTSAFRQLATEGEAQFVSRITFEGPFTTFIGCEKGSGPHNPEKQDFSHPSGDHCSGDKPKSRNLVQSQKRIAKGEKEVQAVTESACRAREKAQTLDWQRHKPECFASKLQWICWESKNRDGELLKASLEAAKQQCRV